MLRDIHCRKIVQGKIVDKQHPSLGELFKYVKIKCLFKVYLTWVQMTSKRSFALILPQSCKKNLI